MVNPLHKRLIEIEIRASKFDLKFADSDEIEPHNRKLRHLDINRSGRDVKITNKIFYSDEERKMFRKIFTSMRKKIKHGSQFDVAAEIKKLYKQAQKDGVFKNIHIEFSSLLTYSEEDINNFNNKKREQYRSRLIFLSSLGLKPSYKSNVIALIPTIRDYFLRASPQAIVQMFKRERRKYY